MPLLIPFPLSVRWKKYYPGKWYVSSTTDLVAYKYMDNIIYIYIWYYLLVIITNFPFLIEYSYFVILLLERKLLTLLIYKFIEKSELTWKEVDLTLI